MRAGKYESKAKRGTAWERSIFGFDLCFQFRSVGSPWEVSNVPPFFREQPGLVPNRGRFLFITGRKLLFNLLVLDALQTAAHYGNSADSAPVRVFFFYRLSDMTLEKFVSRIINVIVYWNVAGCSWRYTTLLLLLWLLGWDWKTSLIGRHYLAILF